MTDVDTELLMQEDVSILAHINAEENCSELFSDYTGVKSNAGPLIYTVYDDFIQIYGTERYNMGFLMKNISSSIPPKDRQSASRLKTLMRFVPSYDSGYPNTTGVYLLTRAFNNGNEYASWSGARIIMTDYYGNNNFKFYLQLFYRTSMLANDSGGTIYTYGHVLPSDTVIPISIEITGVNLLYVTHFFELDILYNHNATTGANALIYNLKIDGVPKVTCTVPYKYTDEEIFNYANGVNAAIANYQYMKHPARIDVFSFEVQTT